MTAPKSRVLVPITTTDSDRAAELALALCQGYGADLQLLNPLVVPEQIPLNQPEERLERERKAAEEALSLLEEGDHEVDISASVRVGHRLDSLVENATSEHNVDLVVLDVDMFAGEFSLGRSAIRRIARNAGCDAVVLSGPGTIEGLRTMLVPIAGGPHSGLAIEVAGALASATEGWVEFLHVVTPASEEDRQWAEEYLDEAVARLDNDRTDSWLLEADDAAEAIVEESEHYDLTIVGTPERHRLRRFLFGSTTDSVTAESTVPVLVAWNYEE